ncbi:MAG: tetratricopeptide repeat protein, partial [Gammaproteobacteria bacterium]|nr:tetratricopeptide repeat protein [Gammaproteobacteria bacterium]
AHYQKALEISERIAAADPSSAAAQRDLSVSYERLGDVQISLGNTDAALAHYQKALEIRERLAAADLSSAAAQRDLSMSYKKLGDVQKTSGNLEQANQYYAQAVNINKKLAQADPNNPTLSSQWASALWKQGQLMAAAEVYSQALFKFPEQLGLLSGDMELAWVQGDQARCQQRIQSLEKLLTPKQARYSIVR